MGKVTLVLSGGGLRGLAHIGVLKAVRALDIPVHEYIGTSMGSLIGALVAGGMDIEEMERLALELKSEHILDLDLLYFARKGLRANSLYRGEALRRYIETVIPIDSFKLLDTTLLVNSVELSRGEEIYWGSEGLDDIPLHEAVYASCALPGMFPPLKIGESYYIDGGVVTNLPVKMAYRRDANLIIAVNLGGPREPIEPREKAVEPRGIIDMILQSSGIMMRRILQLQMREFYEYPLILIKPHLPGRSLFEFEEAERSIREGERAALNVLRDHPMLGAL